MRITIAGGSGFLGRALTRQLVADGHEVVLLTRQAAGATNSEAHAGRVSARAWRPDGTAGEWVDAVERADAVINLAGESIASGRWSAARKASILQSRLLSTRSLVVAIASVAHPPTLLLNASATGYYGNRGDEVLTEDSTPGKDFLAGVCRAWEAEARKVRSSVRLVLLRSGVVLDRDEGALPRMALPFKMMGGGPLGSGRQYIPWIHAADWVQLVAWAVKAERVEGALNVTAPAPVPNAEFSAALGRALGRPSWVPTPAPMLRLALGEMADALLLSSARVIPQRALSLHFRFRYETADAALAALYA
jgi:uncharacterized protein (TIGR01777 family)